jgi:hypothetical protein
MPRDSFIGEKFTRERTTARKLAAEYFEKFPKDRYQTAVESWRHLQSQNIEFTIMSPLPSLRWHHRRQFRAKRLRASAN